MTLSVATENTIEPQNAARPQQAIELAAFRADVMAGLSRPDKRLPCKYLYDAHGSALFDRICELPEYYPTRTELGIMRKHAGDLVAAFARGCVLIEYGSGSSIKTRLLLDHLDHGVGYAPVDVSREHLLAASKSIAADYPHLPVHPICADFTQPFALPSEIDPKAPRVVYFPGSTLGNFPPPDDLALLRNIAATVGPNGGTLIGLDLQKSPAVLEAAYNDSQGVTAAFNLNLLTRINRELGGSFNLKAFAHRALYNRELGRMELYLDSLEAQTVHIDGQRFEFGRGESIHTEYSCKYTLEGFAALAKQATFEVECVFCDDRDYFAMVHLISRP